jgi:hypothetical protein
MKKNYEAPAFDIITYSLQEAIAGGCTVKKYVGMNSGSTSCLDPRFDGYTFGSTEVECTGSGGNSGGSNSFGDGSIYDAMRSAWVNSYSSGTDGGTAGLNGAPLAGFCYFTSTDNIVANS